MEGLNLARDLRVELFLPVRCDEAEDDALEVLDGLDGRLTGVESFGFVVGNEFLWRWNLPLVSRGGSGDCSSTAEFGWFHHGEAERLLLREQRGERR